MQKRKNIMSKTRQIIAEYFNNIYPDHVQRNFAFWLNEKKDREEKDQILREVWDELSVEADPSTEESFRKLQSRILSNKNKTKRFLSFHKLSRIAAILLLPLLSMTVWLYLQKNTPSGDVKLIECMVPNGETWSLILPDSSTVQLNSGSILVYPQHFGKTRNVYLNGEAYFSVVHKDKQPFIVTASDLEIEVLGTVFNVSSYIDSENSSATLEQGKISVRLKNSVHSPVILTANERLTYNRISGLTEKQTVEVDKITAWTKGNILVQGMSMDEIAKIIERKYALKVYLNLSRYENEKITMKFTDGEDINEFMHVLRYLIPNLRYKMEDDKLYIY
jgi:ferric-dicitrate binding protein FerR (iron transport regulator)